MLVFRALAGGAVDGAGMHAGDQHACGQHPNERAAIG